MGRSVAAILLFVVSAIAGCGTGGDALARLPISGEITFKGAPLDQGTIQFTPEGPEAKVGGGAVIKDGKYTIAAEQGLPAGKYKVMISSGEGGAEAEEMPGESDKLAVERIPPEFNTQSKQSVEVTSGKENKFDFKID